MITRNILCIYLTYCYLFIYLFTYLRPRGSIANRHKRLLD